MSHDSSQMKQKIEQLFSHATHFPSSCVLASRTLGFTGGRTGSTSALDTFVPYRVRTVDLLSPSSGKRAAYNAVGL